MEIGVKIDDNMDTYLKLFHYFKIKNAAHLKKVILSCMAQKPISFYRSYFIYLKWTAAQDSQLHPRKGTEFPAHCSLDAPPTKQVSFM